MRTTRAARDVHIASGRRGRSPVPEDSGDGYTWSRDPKNPANGHRGYAAAGGWEVTSRDYFESAGEGEEEPSEGGSVGSAPLAPAPIRSRSRSRERARRSGEYAYVDAYDVPSGSDIYISDKKADMCTRVR